MEFTLVYPIDISNAGSIRQLFTSPQLDFVIDAIAAGNSPGRVWADDADQPTTALVWDTTHSFYLGGAADQTAFNRALGELVTDRLLPGSEAERDKVFKVYTDSGAWDESVQDVFPPYPLMKVERVHFTLEPGRVANRPPLLPDGYRLAQIDQALLADDRLKNTDDVINEIDLCWTIRERFFEYGFGYALCSADDIVCWCTAEYVSGKVCGIGIETVESAQGRGFATLTASAFIEHCRANGITAHWDAWKKNTPSVRVAEKVGFRDRIDYSIYVSHWE